MNELVRFNNLFKVKNPVIGMIHLHALPGTPAFDGSIKEIIKTALNEAKIYQQSGIDSIMIENMHDTPYLKNNVGHEISGIMAIIGYEIKKQTNLTCGIQILAGANHEALAVANSAGLDFIRAEGFVFAHIADEGYIESSAGSLLRYRKQIDAQDVLIFSDIKKKHSSHNITSDTNIVETAQAAEFFRSDGLIITGVSTGKSANLEEIKNVKLHSKLPVLVGSGVNLNNVAEYFPHVDGFIVGSSFKKDSHWKNGVQFDLVKNFMARVFVLRNQK